MRFFESRKKALEDPLFGPITFDRDEWAGRIIIVDAVDPVSIAIDAGPDGPGPEHRDKFRRMLPLLTARSDEITEALFELYSPYLDEPGWEGPKPASPHALRAMLDYDLLYVSMLHPPRVYFGFVGDLWPDASFQIEITDDGVRPIALDD